MTSTFSSSIIGLPRSGTTWIAKILDSHPDVLYYHEPDYVDRIPCVPYVTELDELELWSPYLKDWQLRITNRGSRRTFGKRPEFSKNYLQGAQGSFRKWAYDLKINSRALVEKLGFPERSIETVGFHANAKYRVWKSVESLGRLPVFASCFSKQSFVHVVRHPCGFANSVIQGDRHGKFAKSVPMISDDGLLWWAHRWCEKLGIDVPLDEIVHSSTFVRLAWFWRLMNQGAREASSKLPNYTCIRYDDLCECPAESVKQLFAFLKMGMEKQTTDFLLGVSENQSDQDYFSVKKNSVAVANAWKNSLSVQEIESVMAIAGKTWDDMAPSASPMPV